jgi:hypothetical protein
MATFSYADAVKLLGAKENKILGALDTILSGGLLGGSVLGALELLGWFDAKADFIRLSKQLVGKASEKRHGMSRSDRTERLHAAHSVIVLVAFFEAFDELKIPFTTKTLELTKTRQLGVLDHRIQSILDADVPLLPPEQPYESFLSTLEVWYEGLTLSLDQLILGLAVSDYLIASEREHHLHVMRDQLSGRAVRRYEELLRQLAIDCPEVGFWVMRQDAQATRSEIRTIGTALSRLGQSLAPILLGEGASVHRSELARKYRSVLSHPILESDDKPGGLTIPSLQDCYIDPFFQVADVAQDTAFAQKSWWEDQPVWADLPRFISGHLTSPKALTAPMLMLGDPGSGKSMLTKMLAARLPASDFLVVRVELRSAPAEADVLQQIEHGIKDALKEDVSWPSLARSAGAALPVVLLDGFDELLQATGVTQTDYLTKIARFQRDRADVGHPVAVIVTSRISVADRAIPPPGTVVLRLAPFTPAQTERWLAAWRDANVRYFESTGLKPLDLARTRQYRELSEQPLLLLMLALYDADSNALQQVDGWIDQSELYERLLTRFARREVTKEGDHHTETELTEAVADELERLSIVAFAMFNRGTQWVSEEDVSKDLAILLDLQPAKTGLRSPLSAGGIAMGRFFFVQRSEAIIDQERLATYEFLHATFGEYLVARHIWNIMCDLPSRTSRRSATVDDNELYSLLSFAPLPSRWSVIGFLQEMAQQTEHRLSLSQLVAGLLGTADQAHLRPDRAEYQPAASPMPQRYATYSANLVVLLTVLQPLRISELCGDPAEVVAVWRRYVNLWKSQLSPSDWESLVNSFALSRVWHGEHRDIQLKLESEVHIGIPPLDLNWSIGYRLEANDVVAVHEPSVALDAREIHFSCDETQDVMLHALLPVESAVPYSREVAVSGSGIPISGTHALLGILLGDLPIGRLPIRFERDEYLDVLGILTESSDHVPADMAVSHVFNALRHRSSNFAPRMLARHEWIAKDSRFWHFLCDQVGKGADDAELLTILSEHWHVPAACATFPLELLDAWLRMAERGAETDPSLHYLVSSGLLDLEYLAQNRPDLIKRTRNALRELGHEWDFTL